MSYIFCWIRFQNTNDFLEKYMCNVPVPLKLEGTGRQFVFALKEEESKRILTELELDGHEVSLLGQKFDISDNAPQTYEVAVRYFPEPKYFLKIVDEHRAY